MTGKHTIIVQTKRIKFEMTVERNITILRGDSATGKTTLVDLIKDFDKWGASYGIKVVCDKECVVLEGREWKRSLSFVTDSIVFIDDRNKFVCTDEFAKEVQRTDNYYVIVSREKLPMLPYSINEIYGLRVSERSTAKQVCNEAFHLYQS